MREQTTDKQPDYDIYVAPDRVTIVKNELEDDAVVESVQVATLRPEEPFQWLPPFFFLSHLLIVLLVLSLVVFARVEAAPAQITIYLTGIPDIAELKSLPPISLSQSTTVHTTGHVHIAATQAHGLIYFYNSLTQPQTIQAGMLFVVDGQQYVTDEAVTVPAGNLVTYGHAAVQAHALNPGVRGNIQAGDISGPCCLAFIQAVNGQFSGGQDAQDKQIVTKGDLAQASDTSLSHLKHSLQERMAELPPLPYGSVMLSPVCHMSTAVNHRVGDIAQTVMVKAREVCVPQFYNRQELKHTLLSMIAGKTPDQAKAILARHGIYSVAVNLSFLQERIPSDAANIGLSLLFH